ncbi:MarR family transcriptional regulator [Dactylosporangium sp. AC04546]|uniref:MarR family winged helix-turn-helix transcriptional regulator n=1 Tax=Dactylosporangium sp. AC04546 TaxID=2862460 RepID=UPI001EDEEFD9|nr:MarR family transcriptional regulator [Dactylosporangium sp. AC04546]WVK86227.1 MarR family transcriptional regulator [Dactylosporangium sp. AC04546]
MILELQRATHATLQSLTAELVDLDLTPSDLNALANLADGTPRTVSRLGADVGTRPATLTGILDRLERRGLITRAMHPGDRRSVRIELTEAGAETAAQVRAAMDELERRALAGLPPETLAAALAVLAALTEADR